MVKTHSFFPADPVWLLHTTFELATNPAAELADEVLIFVAHFNASKKLLKSSFFWVKFRLSW